MRSSGEQLMLASAASQQPLCLFVGIRRIHKTLVECRAEREKNNNAK